MNPSSLLINILKYFRFLCQNRRDIRLFVHSAYSQYTYRFILRILSIRTDLHIPRILSIRTDSFCVFSVYEQLDLVRIFTSFRVFSEYIQIHSAYSQYTNRFIPRILSVRTDSFRVFGEFAQIIFNVRNWIIFLRAFKRILLQKKYVCVQVDRRATRNDQLFGPSMTK